MKVALVKIPGTYANWKKEPLLNLTYLTRIIHKKYHCINYDIVNNRVTYSFHDICPLTPCIPLSPIHGGKGEMCRTMLSRRKIE